MFFAAKLKGKSACHDKIRPMTHAEQIASQLHVKPSQVEAVINLLDEGNTVQRFSPRKPKAKYSQANIERLRTLIAQKKVIKEVAETLQEILEEKFIFPPDILKALKANKEAWKNYQKFSDSYKRIRIAFIDGARDRPEEFKKRLHHFIEMTEKNKMFGFGGIDKHY